MVSVLTLFHPEQPKLYGVLAVLSAVGLKILAVFTIFLGYKMDLNFRHCFGREKLNLNLGLFWKGKSPSNSRISTGFYIASLLNANSVLCVYFSFIFYRAIHGLSHLRLHLHSHDTTSCHNPRNQVTAAYFNKICFI